MPESQSSPSAVSLSLPLEEQWTLHHVLLDRIEREAEAPSNVDSPPVEAYRAFETLDAGETDFTVAQLEAIRTVPAAYHHAPEWERDRPRIERLLHRVSDRIERGEQAPAVD